MRKNKFTRRERNKLNKELELALVKADNSVKLVALNTEQNLNNLDPTSPENIEHWMKYSYLSWKK